MIANHTKLIIKQYGATSFNPLPTVIGFFLFGLYIFIYPIKIINDVRSGVIPLVIESDALNINCPNSGEILDCINFGTTIGDSINHLPADAVLNILTIASTNTINIINGTPVNSKLSIIFAHQAVINVGILVFLNTATY